jgi:hypothetical protein
MANFNRTCRSARRQTRQSHIPKVNLATVRTGCLNIQVWQITRWLEEWEIITEGAGGQRSSIDRTFILCPIP